MEPALGTSYTPQGALRGRYALVRYADDLAVFSPSKEAAIAAHSLMNQGLGTRGLRLADEKTQMRHRSDGRNVLGFTIRHDPTPQSSRSGSKLLIKPSQDAIQQIKRTCKRRWRQPVGSPTVALINAMNPVIRGWSHYFRSGVAKEVFNDLDRFMYERAQRYRNRRHPRIWLVEDAEIWGPNPRSTGPRGLSG